MLKYFSVSGYKNFDEPIELDFSDVRDYKFSTDCINNDLLGKIVLYGKNAIGKSNFARALHDIYILCTDLSAKPKDSHYLNVKNAEGCAEFLYVFQFDNDIVEYRYKKTAPCELVYEKITINEKLLIEFDRQRPENMIASGLVELAPTLGLDFMKVKSVLSYIVSNTQLDTTHPLSKTISFVSRFLLDASSENISDYSSVSLEWIISDTNRLKSFEELLRIAGIPYKLTVLNDPTGKQVLYYDTSPPLPFNSVASSGTKTLCSLFILYSLVKNSEQSFFYIIDEFDAFYHYELAEHLIKMLIALPNVQVVFTSHNTSLLTNRFMRPDCCFIMTKDKLTSLPNATAMELREGHNLQKLFIGGEFDE